MANYLTCIYVISSSRCIIHVILRWHVYHSIVPIWRSHWSSHPLINLEVVTEKQQIWVAYCVHIFLFLVSTCSIISWYIHVHYIHVGLSITLLSLVYFKKGYFNILPKMCLHITFTGRSISPLIKTFAVFAVLSAHIIFPNELYVGGYLWINWHKRTTAT